MMERSGDVAAHLEQDLKGHGFVAGQRCAGEAAQGLTFWAEREHFLMVGDRPEILFEVSFEESLGPVEDAE